MIFVPARVALRYDPVRGRDKKWRDASLARPRYVQLEAVKVHVRESDRLNLARTALLPGRAHYRNSYGNQCKTARGQDDTRERSD
jgi:hypothetical protein